MAYSYVVSQTVGGEVIAELPLSKVSYESFVSAPGQLKAELVMPGVGDAKDRALAALYRSAVDPVRCCLHVLRDGAPMWGGPLWVTGYTMATRTVTIQAAEWFSMLARRYITGFFFAPDPVEIHEIVRDLLAYTQAKGDLGILPDSSDGGKEYQYNYYPHEQRQIAKVITDLGAQADGFEFGIDLAYDDDGNLTRTLHLDSPRRGRSVVDSKLVFEHGRNLVAWAEQNDGTQMAATVLGIGSGDGIAALQSTQSPTIPVGGYPLVEGTVSYKDVTDQTLLDDLTQAEADRVRLPVRTVGATVLPGSPDLGSYRTGDEARFVIPAGVDPYYVDGLDEINRIMGIKVTVDDDGGKDLVDLTLVNRPYTDAIRQNDLDRRLKALEATA